VGASEHSKSLQSWWKDKSSRMIGEIKVVCEEEFVVDLMKNVFAIGCLS
jgi:hypothetical protein